MINLLFTGNDKIFDGLAIALISIVKHCKEPLNVVVLTMNLEELNPNYKSLKPKQIEMLENYIKTVNSASKIQLVDTTELFKGKNKDSVNMENSYSPYAFLRLLANEVKEVGDKVLYLDIDIVANGDIKELYDYDVTDYEYGAVRDYYGRVFINRNYVNSGVMLLNMKKIRETKLFERCREMVNTKKLAFPDQTALNKLATAKLYLPRKFNSQRKYHEEDVIRHFCKSIRWYPSFRTKKNPYKKHCEPFSKWFRLFHTVNVKPWHKEAMHALLDCHEFDDVLEAYFKLMQEYESKQIKEKQKNYIESRKEVINSRAINSSKIRV